MIDTIPPMGYIAFMTETKNATRRARTSKSDGRIGSPKHATVCCSEESTQVHPDHSEYLPRLSRIQGQIAGIERMISERRYCVDILIQFRAVMAALRSVEVGMFETHLKHCVTAAMQARDPKQIDAKVKELTELLARRSSL